MIKFYNPCVACGSSDLIVIRTTPNIKGVPVGTRCVGCKCGRLTEVEKWNVLNKRKGE